MPVLTARELTRQFDVDPVFRDVTFDVQPGDRIGLVGPNGTGKTTLLKILAGQDHPDVGVVEQSSDTTVALLEQHPDFSQPRTLFEEAKSGLAPLYALQQEALNLAERLATEDSPEQLARLHKRYDAVIHDLDRHDAHQLDHRVEAVLSGLGFKPEEYDRPMRQLSGGQQNRAILARILLTAPDLMLLDEPTNHLDIAATEWLEDYLTRSNQTLIVVSHDRYFLDKVTTRTLELFQGKAMLYKGNFSAYWRQREERLEFLRKNYEKQQEFVARTEDFIRRNSYGQKHAQAQDRIKKLDRLERVEQVREMHDAAMTFGTPTRTGDWVIDANHISKGFGTPLFRDFTLRLPRGERLAVLGPNGIGKTTLLRTLIGELSPDSGTVRFGTGVKLAYYDQQLGSVDPNLDAIDAVRPPENPLMPAAEIRSLLARFGLSGDIVFQSVGSMSGGERSRVALAHLSARNANVLALDEPTNHLDLWARQSLERALKEFHGTLLFVSHDRYFVNQLATSVIVFEADGWHHYHGNYSDYIEFLKHRAEEERERRAEAALAEARKSDKSSAGLERTAEHGPNRTEKQRRKRKFPYRKPDDIEAEVAEKESLLAKLQDEMADPKIQRDGKRLHQLAQDYEQLRGEVSVLYEHWEEALELS